MKTIVLTLTIILISISLMGQTSNRKSETNPLLKSTNVSKLRLDSIVSTNGYKIADYSYDSRGKNIKSIVYDYSIFESSECFMIQMEI